MESLTRQQELDGLSALIPTASCLVALVAEGVRVTSRGLGAEARCALLAGALIGELRDLADASMRTRLLAKLIAYTTPAVTLVEAAVEGPLCATCAIPDPSFQGEHCDRYTCARHSDFHAVPASADDALWICEACWKVLSHGY